MKKKIKTIKKEVTEEPISLSEFTPVVETRVEPKKEIGRFHASFPSEDLTKLVEKINEIIDHINGSI